MNDNSLKAPQQYVNLEQNSDEMLEEMYPDIYRIVYPYVIDIADSLCSGGYVTARMIDSAVDAVYSVSGFSEPAIPAASGNYDGYGRDRHDFHRDGFSRDLIRILLLRHLIDHRRNHRSPRYMPYY